MCWDFNLGSNNLFKKLAKAYKSERMGVLFYKAVVFWVVISHLYASSLKRDTRYP